jgi:hypothetical protein
VEALSNGGLVSTDATLVLSLWCARLAPRRSTDHSVMAGGNKLITLPFFVL